LSELDEIRRRLAALESRAGALTEAQAETRRPADPFAARL